MPRKGLPRNPGESIALAEHSFPFQQRKPIGRTDQLDAAAGMRYGTQTKRSLITTFADWAKNGWKRARSFREAKKFIREFEEIEVNGYTIKLDREPAAGFLELRVSQSNTRIGGLELVFETTRNGKTIIIEGIQGTQGVKREVTGFRERMGRGWASFLLKELERQAKKLGFDSIRILKPEHIKPLQSYNEQREAEYWERLTREDAEKIYKRTTGMYYAIAKDAGYKKQGKFLVKQL